MSDIRYNGKNVKTPARGDERGSGAQAAIGRVQKLVRLVGLGTE